MHLLPAVHLTSKLLSTFKKQNLSRFFLDCRFVGENMYINCVQCSSNCSYRILRSVSHHNYVMWSNGWCWYCGTQFTCWCWRCFEVWNQSHLNWANTWLPLATSLLLSISCWHTWNLGATKFSFSHRWHECSTFCRIILDIAVCSWCALNTFVTKHIHGGPKHIHHFVVGVTQSKVNWFK